MDWQAISLTARLAALVSVILLVISLPSPTGSPSRGGGGRS